MTTLEAIYENGIFRPVAEVPKSVKENETVRIIIETDSDEELLAEFAQWDEAGERDAVRFESSLGEQT